jgi:hypothetical protein
VGAGHRPPPLHAIVSECLLPAARGYVWHQSPEDGLWYPLEPSSWPHSPPDSELEIGTIISEALPWASQLWCSYLTSRMVTPVPSCNVRRSSDHPTSVHLRMLPHSRSVQQRIGFMGGCAGVARRRRYGPCVLTP